MEKSNNRIDQYLSGSLDELALSDFERELTKDENLRQELQLRKEIRAGLVKWHHHKLKNQFAEFAKSEYPGAQVSDTSQRPDARIRSLRFYLAAAASLALIAVLSYVVYTNLSKSLSPDEVYASAFTMPPLDNFSRVNTVKGENPDPVVQPQDYAYQEWTLAKEAYSKNNYSAALELANTVNAEALLSDDQPEFLFLKGLLHMENGQYTEAEAIFSNPQVIDPTSRQWYLALLLLKKGSDKPSIELAFSQIANDRTNPWKEKALEVLEQLGY